MVRSVHPSSKEQGVGSRAHIRQLSTTCNLSSRKPSGSISTIQTHVHPHRKPTIVNKINCFVSLFFKTGFLSVDLAGLKLRDLPASASQVLGLKVMHHLSNKSFFFLSKH